MARTTPVGCYKRWMVVAWCAPILAPLAVLAFSSNPSLSETQTTKNVATQILQGVGPVEQSTLDQYNLPFSECVDHWTANLVRGVNDQASKLKLGCKDDDTNLFVDTVTVEYERRSNALGLDLLELAGGRSDGLGIVTVSESNVEGVQPGDCLSKVRVRRREQVSKQEETNQIVTASVECLDFDATVAQLRTLPDYQPDDVYSLIVKRLRRKPAVNVNIQYPPDDPNHKDVSLQLFAGENLRQALLTRGIAINDEVSQRFDTKSSGNCGAGGLCRTCSVVVVQNSDQVLNPQRQAEQQMFADAPRYRLACKAIVGFGMKEGNLTIKAFPSRW